MTWITAGRIVRAVGLRGEVAVAGTDGALGEVASLGLRRSGGAVEVRRLLAARPQGRVWVARLQGVEGREEAEALHGAEVLVEREALGEAGPDRHYWADLQGAAVVTLGGEALGVVTGLLATGGVDVLEVTGEGGELLVPLAPYVTVDREGHRILVDPPEGLLEVQRGEREEESRGRGGERA